MKKLIAKKISLKRKCFYCDRVIKKGEVYYKDRSIYHDEDKIYSSELISCSKCKYKLEQHVKRYTSFVEKCEHPKWAVETSWSYIPGECVKEPDYDVCRLCGKAV